MSLTRSAINSSRLTLFAALLILLVGVLTFLGFPSQEEPSVTVRDALVSIAFNGLPVERAEELLARPTEEKLRELPEIKNLVTTVRPGSVIIQVTAYDEIKDLAALWLKVRNKAAEAGAGFPAGTQGPFVDDDFGRVTVASVAVTAPGYSMVTPCQVSSRSSCMACRMSGCTSILIASAWLLRACPSSNWSSNCRGRTSSPWAERRYWVGRTPP